jgi:hypothetical protein
MYVRATEGQLRETGNAFPVAQTGGKIHHEHSAIPDVVPHNDAEVAVGAHDDPFLDGAWRGSQPITGNTFPVGLLRAKGTLRHSSGSRMAVSPTALQVQPN